MKLLKTNILRIVLFCLIFSNIVKAADPADKKPPTTSAEKIANFLVYKGIPISVALFYLSFIAKDEVRETFQEQLKAKNLLKNFSKEFLSYALITVIHELSHAICVKYFTKNDSTINLFGSSKAPPLLDLNNFKIKGLNPRKGSCEFSLDKNFQEQNKLKYSLIYLSGGLGGALAATLLSLMTNALEKKPINAKNIFVNPILFEQLSNALIPIGKNSDAAMIWKNFHIPEKTIDSASKLQSFLYVFLEFYAAQAQAQAENVNYVDLFFATLLNLQTKGFFRFHV